MTLPLNLETSAYEAVVLPSSSTASQPPAATALVQAGLLDSFADRACELHSSLQAVRAEFEAFLGDQLVETEEFRNLGEAAHKQAEEADALLMLLVRCKAPEALIQEVEEIFDTLRSLEEQFTEAAEWNKGMGRRLTALGKSPNGQRLRP